MAHLSEHVNATDVQIAVKRLSLIFRRHSDINKILTLISLAVDTSS